MTISRLQDGEAVFFMMYLSQGCWWWVSSWYPHSCSSCNIIHSHLTHYSLNSHPASGRVGYCSKGTLGTTTCKAEPVGTCWQKLAYLLGFVLVHLPLLHKEAVNQFYPANQKQELNGLLTRPPKQEAGDSPRSRRRGTNSKQRTPRRLAAAKATGETRPSCVPIIRLHLEVEPTGIQLTTLWSSPKVTKLSQGARSLGSRISDDKSALDYLG